MATLTIRNLPDDVHAQLRQRAARAGRSMEAEARAVLAAAVLAGDPPVGVAALQSLVRALYDGAPPTGVVDSLIADRRRAARDE